MSRREVGIAYLCILPWLIGFVVFTAYPLIISGYYSFTHYPILGGPTWAGLDNYRDLLEDELFWKSLRVTAVYSAFAVPGSVVIGYAIAMLLNQRVRWLRVWRTAYFLPSLVPAIAGAFLWSWIFNGQYGLVNGVLRQFGVEGPQWFASEEWVLPAFVIMTLWGAGGGMILYLAALQQVPSTLYDAAEIDGANAWHRLIHISIPMTSPVILFQFVTGLIASFQIFTAGYIVTNGGPNNASLFYVLYLYRNGWQDFQMGYASALAWVLVLIMMVLTLVTLLVARRAVYYEYGGR
ncbi:carbohydrate ABC transporter permease [Tenggerimyces flavus]|uniref:Carbohydrate ABC transporter permease n=1 Tax=Tenggerimyces flavus TaxID=1708749 RepID=A0ABV7YJ47_9ACTN|nr:sugar ABC transporter permease [Tenggerimyces flavus]MBM7789609.1 multiple sugar transport system permease protein [Tenggerimyces flavus]